jgi:molybdate transport system permease protein
LIVDWPALVLSLKLGGSTLAVLLPISLVIGRALAVRTFRGKGVAEALVALPLVLPPTVLGFYLLVAFGARSPLGQMVVALTGRTLAFSFAGLLFASVLINVPFAVQPIQRAFEGIPDDLREAAACCGMTPRRAFIAVELPLAWPGIISAMVLTFAHTLGEFGVVLMVGGNIPHETRTLSIAIYDRMQAFDDRAAGLMAAMLLVVALVTLTVTHVLGRRMGRRRG